MDERRANIDLAFRNGLKDYEVLPPADVWMTIDSRITSKERPAYFLRAAAFLAIAMTLSVLAYRWIGKTSINTTLADNQESSAPVTAVNIAAPVPDKRETSVSSGQILGTIAEVTADESPVAAMDYPVSPVMIYPETNLRFPLNTSSLGIIHNQAGSTVPPVTTLSVDNAGQEFQEYLADNSTGTKASKWSIAALATPTYYGKINSGSDEFSKQLMASEQAVVSYSGGVALSYKVNKRLSVQSGLFYSSIGQEVDGINSFAGFQKYVTSKGDHNFEVLTTNGSVYSRNADVFLMADGSNERIITNYNKDVFDPQKASLDYINNTMRQSMSYLELPVFLRYKVIDRSVDFELIGGMSYNLLVDNSVYTVIDGNKYMIGTTQGLNMFSISSSLGMGMEYSFSSKLSLNLEPTFRYYINTFNNSGSSNFHPYSFGIFSGISYKF